MKQENLFGEEFADEEASKYVAKIQIPIYEPKNKKPNVLELVDTSKTSRLMIEIKNSNVTEEEKRFLTAAARRHNVFNYQRIADYYAGSNKEMQILMEKSALVIIDFEDAINYGYTRLSMEVANQYFKEYGNEE
jgi:hypothetical protein